MMLLAAMVNVFLFSYVDQNALIKKVCPLERLLGLT